MESRILNVHTVRIKAAIAGGLIPLVLFTANQLFLQIFKPSDQPLDIRIAFAVSPTVYLLYGVAAVIIVLVAMRKLTILFKYFKDDENPGRARRSTLSIPWILIITNSCLWLAAITLFYSLQGFRTAGGVPYFWSLTTNSISGCVSAILAALVINRILIPAKIHLNMTDIREGENDLFMRIKLPLIVCTGSAYLALNLIYVSKYYAVSITENLPLLKVDFGTVMAAAALTGFIPMLLNIIMALTEDKIQRNFLLKRMQEITSGNGDLSGKVNLINFDEIGELAAIINSFIVKIRTLVVKTDRTGSQLAETSAEIENILGMLSAETGTMLDGFNSIDSSMSEQENEIIGAKASLNEYFTALTDLTDNIDSQSSSVTQTSKAAEDIAASVKKDSAVVKEIEQQTEALSRITETGSSHISDFLNSIKNIESSTANVEEILGHISSLSQQIDLLAMNAAIEAAHAGDAGKGFAVVADEVRKLSENTAEESGQIAVQVELMRTSVTQGNRKTALADKAFLDIQKNVELTAEHFKTVTESSLKEEASVDELLTTVGHLVHITESLKLITKSQKEHNEKMKSLLENVFGRFGVLKDSMGAQRKNRETVSRNLEKMQRITNENLKVVIELKEILTQFSF